MQREKKHNEATSNDPPISQSTPEISKLDKKESEQQQPKSKSENTIQVLHKPHDRQISLEDPEMDEDFLRACQERKQFRRAMGIPDKSGKLRVTGIHKKHSVEHEHEHEHEIYYPERQNNDDCCCLCDFLFCGICQSNKTKTIETPRANSGAGIDDKDTSIHGLEMLKALPIESNEAIPTHNGTKNAKPAAAAAAGEKKMTVITQQPKDDVAKRKK